MNPQLGYLVSQYPAYSHTFILREVRGLRERGFTIAVASINAADRPAARLTAIEREEHAETFYVKAAGAGGAFKVLLKNLFRRPRRLLAGLRFGCKLGGWDIRRQLYNLAYFAEALLVGDWLERRGLTHLHAHFATPAATVGLLVRRMFPVTYSITVHGPDEFYDAPGYYLPQKIAGADFVLCIGFYAQSQLMKLSPPAQWGKFAVTPLGVDPDAFAPRPAPQNNIFEILCVGRLVAAKGQHILLQAAALLVQQGRQLRLRYVGDGPDRASLAQAITAQSLQDSVILEGAVDQDRIREFYRQADVFCLASFAEGIPVVLMEAMAMTVPCVTTCITGIPELIEHGREGLLVMPSDVAGLAAALARLQDDPVLRETLGRQGREKVLSHYHLPHNLDRLAATFRQRLA